MYKYEIIIYWDNQDGVYIADVPELPGCSAHGKTYNAALDNAKEAIRL
jgi:predicted RNase H-like HicB family nuclease